MDESSEALGWVIRELRFERWLDGLVAAVDAEAGDAESVEETRRPA